MGCIAYDCYLPFLFKGLAKDRRKVRRNLYKIAHTKAQEIKFKCNLYVPIAK
jgi:hypothetical protein